MSSKVTILHYNGLHPLKNVPTEGGHYTYCPNCRKWISQEDVKHDGNRGKCPGCDLTLSEDGIYRAYKHANSLDRFLGARGSGTQDR